MATLEDLDDGKLCKRPLDYVDGKPLEKLLTLKDYIDGGHEMINVKLLVCVRSVGAKKKGQHCHDLLMFFSYSTRHSAEQEQPSQRARYYSCFRRYLRCISDTVG